MKMSNPDFETTAGSAQITIGGICKDAFGNAVDLTDADVITFRLRSTDGTVVVNDSIGAKDLATLGHVHYTLTSTDLATAGLFWGYFTVEWPTAPRTKKKFPTDPLLIEIEAL